MIKTMGKSLAAISLGTLLLILYVHEQVALFRVSYAIDEKSDMLERMNEEYRHVKFELDQLKAPRLLEEKMRELALDLTLPKEVQVIRTPAPVLEASTDAQMNFSGRVFGFLGRWVDVAQAKTESS